MGRPQHGMNTHDHARNELIDNLLRLLVSRGAHIDVADSNGGTVLGKMPDDVLCLPLPLKCLAARTLRNYVRATKQLPSTVYGRLPKLIIKFADMH